MHREVKVSCIVRAMPKDGQLMHGQETLDAQTEFGNEDADGRSHHRVNQYTILEEVGRGSYGAVHLATDQFGQEFVRAAPLRQKFLPFRLANIIRPSKSSQSPDCASAHSRISCDRVLVGHGLEESDPA